MSDVVTMGVAYYYTLESGLAILYLAFSEHFLAVEPFDFWE